MARVPVSSLACMVLAVGVVLPGAGALVRRGSDDASMRSLRLASATGAITISDSREGEAILSATPMTPGQRATGTVTIANTGAGSEQLHVDAGVPVDRPGPGGGRLSQRLRLEVTDVTVPAQARAVFSGGVADLDQADLGSWAAGTARTYRFDVTFPDGGAGGADNAFQGSSATVAFDWIATEGAGAESAQAGPSVAPAAAGGGGSGGGAAAAPAGGGDAPAASADHGDAGTPAAPGAPADAAEPAAAPPAAATACTTSKEAPAAKRPATRKTTTTSAARRAAARRAAARRAATRRAAARRATARRAVTRGTARRARAASTAVAPRTKAKVAQCLRRPAQPVVPPR